MIKDLSSMTAAALSVILESNSKVTHSKLAKHISDYFSIEKKQADSIIRQLIQQEELTYTYQYGCSFLERSFAKPVRITSRIIVTPPNRSVTPAFPQIVIKLQRGASFGDGNHPTTRMSLIGIDRALEHPDADQLSDGSCLDIGTGSGILVIAAVLLGVHSGMGIDTDPNAIFDAKNNVAINYLNPRIVIEDTPLEKIEGVFSLISANLRYPTLIRIFPHILRLLDNHGYVVLSGFKIHEMTDIMATYTPAFKPLWSDESKGWGSVLLKKQPCGIPYRYLEDNQR